MPLNVRRFCTSVLLVFTFSILASAQTSADVMRDRVAKAKAYIAVRNYNAAIYELENIRRESNDSTVRSVINVLLMNSYLDQGDYKRAQDFLKELAAPSKSNKSSAEVDYFAVAGQVVKGARNQLERYKALGLSVADRNLPLEALTDIEKMRETLETVVEQSKVLSKDKNQTSNAMALIEEATNVRSNLARDNYDAKRWKDEVADAREMLANSRSVIVNAVDGSTTNAASIPVSNSSLPVLSASTAKPNETNALQPIPNSSTNRIINPPPAEQAKTEKTNEEARKPNETKTVAPENKEAAKNSPVNRDRRTESPNSENKTETQASASDSAKRSEPLQVGSLVEYATQKTNPVYPPAAKNIRMSGIVKVELVVDETGQVAEVQKTSGPSILQRAALDAIKKWKFKPFTRDGQPIKATGFINFNFSL